ncbi:MAG: polymerase, sigma-24 subunit, subfamily protein [Frankiales bacterium]|nr:polymerase, sigma-24 subunit, subfamily protein [Frankiales bacterium]
MAVRSEFDGFVVANSPRLLRTAFLLTRDEAGAQDLLQTALVHAWRAWGRIYGDPMPYVRKIIVNAYTSSWRRKWRAEVPTAELRDLAYEERGSAEDRDVMWTALGRLPRRQRAVMVLRYFEDLTEAQTAEVLGVSIGTVKSQTSKALGHLRVDPTLTPAPASAMEEN